MYAVLFGLTRQSTTPLLRFNLSLLLCDKTAKPEWCQSQNVKTIQQNLDLPNSTVCVVQSFMGYGGKDNLLISSIFLVVAIFDEKWQISVVLTSCTDLQTSKQVLQLDDSFKREYFVVFKLKHTVYKNLTQTKCCAKIMLLLFQMIEVYDMDKVCLRYQ